MQWGKGAKDTKDACLTRLQVVCCQGTQSLVRATWFCLNFTLFVAFITFAAAVFSTTQLCYTRTEWAAVVSAALTPPCALPRRAERRTLPLQLGSVVAKPSTGQLSSVKERLSRVSQPQCSPTNTLLSSHLFKLTFEKSFKLFAYDKHVKRAWLMAHFTKFPAGRYPKENNATRPCYFWLACLSLSSVKLNCNELVLVIWLIKIRRT